MLQLVNQISALYLQKGCISLSGKVISRSGQQKLYVPSLYSYYFDLMLIFQSSSVMTILPAWKSHRTSCYSIQFHLTWPYQNHLFYRPASMRSTRKKLCLPHQQLRLSMLCYRMTCSISTNTIDCLYQHHK